MSFILHPVQYAIQRTVAAVLKTPERGTRVTGLTVDDDAATRVNLEHESLAFDPQRGFKPNFVPSWHKPKNDQEAQRLYNHLRTFAWYADSLPSLSPKLPFNIGIDAIIGFIPYVGDAIGALIGLYLVFLASLFGLPARILAVMVALVVVDTIVGAVPLIGDALDVAFKSNLYILHLLEHHLTQTRGKCSAGEFHIVMPPSGQFVSKATPSSARPQTSARPGSFPPRQPPQAYSRPQNPEDDPPEYLPGQFSSTTSDFRADSRADFRNGAVGSGRVHPSTTSTQPGMTASSGGSRGAVTMAPVDSVACDLPAVPLALPAQFLTSADEATPASIVAAPSDDEARSEGARSSQKLSSPFKTPEDERTDDDSADGSGEESQDEEDALLLVPTALNAASSPGRAHVESIRSRSPSGTRRSPSRTRRANRGVSWHADVPDGHSDDLEQNSTMRTRPSRPSSQGPDFGASPSSISAGTIRGRKAKYLIIYSAIFAIAYVTSLDANTGYLYLNFACSEFGALASFSTVAICQQMIYAIAKPPIAKLSDVFGRAEALLLALLLYSTGYAIVSTAQSLEILIGGIILQSAGNTGVQVLQSIIIADLTTAKWRGLVISLVNLPYLINFAVAGPLVDAVMQSFGWRVGYGMWSVIVPLAAAPLVIILAVGQSQARSAGLLARPQIFGRGCGAAIAQLASEIDALGLLLFTVSWTLILGPLTLAGHGSSSPRGMAASVVSVGLLLLGAFVYWETRAKNPIMPLRFFKNRAVVCVCLIGIVDFASFYLSWTYISAYVQIVKGWGQTQTGYFATTQNVTSTVIGIIVGSLMACTRRFKMFLVGGAIVRLIGVSLMIRYRNAHDPTIMLVLCQLLQGIGGGSVAITMQIAAQVCVRHADVAIVTALELLTTEIGAAMGSATAGLIFKTVLPIKLRENLPGMTDAEILEIYGSLSKVTSYPLGSYERTAIGDAWTDTMRQLCVVATIILLPAVPLALAIPDFILPDSHRRPRSHHHHHHHHHHHRSSTSGSERRESQRLSGRLSPDGRASRRQGVRVKRSTSRTRLGSQARNGTHDTHSPGASPRRLAIESKSSSMSGTTATTATTDEYEGQSNASNASNANADASVLRRSILGDEDDGIESEPSAPRGRSADVVTLGGSRRGSRTVRGSPEEFEREPLLGGGADSGQGGAQHTHTGAYHLS